jgi:predicted TIM-barrel fold metal-dependent hydrolase
MSGKKSEPDEPFESPIAFVPASNGERTPPQPTERDRRAITLFRELADLRARRLGVSRRDFLRSAAGAATALAVIDSVYGCSSGEGGSEPMRDGGLRDTGGDRDAFFPMDDAAGMEDAAACEALAGDEWIFDVQVHHVDPNAPWRTERPRAFGAGAFPQGACGEAEPLDCYNAEHFIREVFVNSDTHVACLSGVPAEAATDPLPNTSRRETAAIVERLSGSPRLLIHASVFPEQGAAQIEAMDAAAAELRPAAWKFFPSQGPWRFTDAATGIAACEKARETGVRILCAHRGLSGDSGGYDDLSSPRDMGAAAAMFPDLTFIAYHSGWEGFVTEGPYDPAEANPRGINRMVRAAIEHGVAKTGNFYAELGSTWRALMTRPDQAAHALGKLLLHVGEDRILWGSDCIWYGSPQEQIVAFRTFQIPEPMRAMYGYPEITPAIRAKIFGLNAAQAYGVDPAARLCAIGDDDLATLRAEARAEGRLMPASRPLGPRSRREWLRFLANG